MDARFTLAAERTLLAWVRTSLGFIAAGMAVVYVARDRVSHPGLEVVLGLMLVTLGCTIAILGASRWRQTERALRGDGRMPGARYVVFLVIAIVVIAMATAVVVTIQA